LPSEIRKEYGVDPDVCSDINDNALRFDVLKAKPDLLLLETPSGIQAASYFRIGVVAEIVPPNGELFSGV
jgi:hypothetical protein